MTDRSKLVYERDFGNGEIPSAEVLGNAVREFPGAYDRDVRVREDAAGARIDPAELRAIDADAIRVTGQRPGLSGLEGEIVFWFATYVSQTVIEEVLVPWLKRRFGKDAVGHKKDHDS